MHWDLICGLSKLAYIEMQINRLHLCLTPVCTPALGAEVSNLLLGLPAYLIRIAHVKALSPGQGGAVGFCQRLGQCGERREQVTPEMSPVVRGQALPL